MTSPFPDVECEQCRTPLSHDDPTWTGQIIDGQVVPVCADCAVLAGFTREGIE